MRDKRSLLLAKNAFGHSNGRHGFRPTSIFLYRGDIGMQKSCHGLLPNNGVLQ